MECLKIERNVRENKVTRYRRNLDLEKGNEKKYFKVQNSKLNVEKCFRILKYIIYMYLCI